MKNLSFLITLLFVFAACGNRQAKQEMAKDTAAAKESTTSIENISANDDHNARNSLSYGGVYEGTTPCADCPGIDMVITLDYEGNYTKKMTYRDKEPDNVFTTSGKFTWDDSGSIITLTGEKDGGTYYKVIENALIMLDADKKEVTGVNADKYVLRQTKMME